MTLAEMSLEYQESARKLSTCLRPLRARLRASEDPDEQFQLKQKIQALTVVLTQTRELAELTAHYYERGYWRNEKYSI